MKTLARIAVGIMLVIAASACNTVEQYRENGLAGAGALEFSPETEENWDKYSKRFGQGLFLLSADGKDSAYTYCEGINCRNEDPAFRIWQCENSVKKPCFVYAAGGTIVWDLSSTTRRPALDYKLTGEADNSHNERTSLTLPIYFSWQDKPSIKKAKLSFDTPWKGKIQFENTGNPECQGQFALRDQLMNFAYHGRWIVDCSDGSNAMGVATFRFSNPIMLKTNDLKVNGSNSLGGSVNFSLSP